MTNVTAREAARHADGTFGQQTHERPPRGLLDAQKVESDAAPSPTFAVEALFLSEAPNLDEDQVSSLWNRTLSKVSGKPLKQAELEKLHEFCEEHDVTPPVNPAEARAIQMIPSRTDKAARALARQARSIAALTETETETVEHRISQFREQYLADLAYLSPAVRPDPPEDWVKGFTSRDFMAVSAPHDPATLYAYYRAQADPDAFSPEERVPTTYASIDLETAGPEGKIGMEPENGRIIEVAVVTYSSAGEEIERMSTLVHPGPEAMASYGTGADHFHGITKDAVRDAPAWDQVAPIVDRQLAGKRMLAQNDRFERNWLDLHLEAEGIDFDHRSPGVDTFQMARQHLGHLPSHKLQDICADQGVAYTNGHRAVHDAEVAAAVFFKLRQQIRDRWTLSPIHAGTPLPQNRAVRA